MEIEHRQFAGDYALGYGVVKYFDAHNVDLKNRPQLMAVKIGYGTPEQIVKRVDPNDGTAYREFVSQPHERIQVGTMAFKSGHVVLPHRHHPKKREGSPPFEMLFVMRGGIEVTLIGVMECHTLSLRPGEFLILLEGGHSMRAITDVDFLYFKEGPYHGRDDDKINLDRGNPTPQPSADAVHG